jgi:hypothetical protein
MFPNGNVFRLQLAVSRDQRRLCSDSARPGSGLLTLFTRHGEVKTYLTTNRQAFNEGPKRPFLLSREPKYVTTINSQ